MGQKVVVFWVMAIAISLTIYGWAEDFGSYSNYSVATVGNDGGSGYESYTNVSTALNEMYGGEASAPTESSQTGSNGTATIPEVLNEMAERGLTSGDSTNNSGEFVSLVQATPELMQNPAVQNAIQDYVTNAAGTVKASIISQMECMNCGSEYNANHDRGYSDGLKETHSGQMIPLDGTGYSVGYEQGTQQKNAASHQDRSFTMGGDGTNPMDTAETTASKALESFNAGDFGTARSKYEASIEVINDYNKGLKTEGQQPIPLESLQNGGVAALKTGEFGQAVEYLSNAITLAPGNADNFDNRGLAYVGLSQYDAASADYQQAETLRSTSESHTNLKNALDQASLQESDMSYTTHP